MTAKPISIKCAERKSGGRAWKAVELTSGDLSGCFDASSELGGSQGPLIAGQKSAAGVVPVGRPLAVGQGRPKRYGMDEGAQVSAALWQKTRRKSGLCGDAGR